LPTKLIIAIATAKFITPTAIRIYRLAILRSFLVAIFVIEFSSLSFIISANSSASSDLAPLQIFKRQT